MTAADLCSSYKQWEVQRSNVSIIMEEFFQQVIDFIPSLIHSLLLCKLIITNTMGRNSRFLFLFFFQWRFTIINDDISRFMCDV